jgi:hypothetical protein
MNPFPQPNGAPLQAHPGKLFGQGRNFIEGEKKVIVYCGRQRFPLLKVFFK